jgi:hypothetical protein
VITVTDAPDASVERAVGDGLRRYNAQQSGIDDVRPLAVVVSDPDTREVVGGITGRPSLGLLFIDLVYLPDDLRGGGLGSRIRQGSGRRGPPARLARVRRDSVRPTGDEPHLHDQDSVLT